MNLKFSLVLEEIDPETGCVARDWQLGDVDVGALSQLVGDDFSDIQQADYDLDRDDVRLISSTLLDETLDLEQGVLRRRHAFLDALPYRIHTRRELAMMLQGDKPLARFVLGPGKEFESVIRQPFAKHVKSGLLRAFVEHDERGSGTVKTYSFTLPGEEWRVAAMRELWDTGLETLSADEFERREGNLLGYADWQTDAFLKLRREMLERSTVE